MKKIPRPKCKTCIYWDSRPSAKMPDDGMCMFAPKPVAKTASEFCGEHNEFNTYEAAVRVAGLKCITCKHLKDASKKEKQEDKEFLGRCMLTRQHSYTFHGGCYLHEKIYEPVRRKKL